MKNNGSSFSNFKLLIKDVFAYKPSRAFLNLTLVILLGITNGVSLAVLIPLLQMTSVGTLNQADDYTSKFVVNLFNSLGISPSLGGVLAIFFLVFFAMSLLQYQQQKVATSLANSFSAYKREGLYKRLFNAQWTFFIRKKMAYTASILTVEAQRVMVASDSMFRLISESFITLCYIILAYLLSWQTTTIVVCAGALISWFMRRLVHAGRKIGENITNYNNELQSAVWEHLGSAKVIKSYAAEKQSSGLFRKLVYTVSDLYTLYIVNQAKIRAVFEPVTVVLLCIGLYIALTYFNVDMAYLIVLLLIFYRLFPKITLVQQSYHKFLTALPAYNAICSLEHEACMTQESPEGKTKITSFDKGITMKNVTFAYEPGKVDILNDINIIIPYGKTIALVGESGSGKSTFADLILGLLLPKKGNIYIDDTDLRGINMDSWRSFIGYVTQDTVLFHDSVLANLLWANPDATEKDVSEVLKIAAADIFVKDLAEGHNTIIGDRGIRLSGGQRQRLALARALLRKPRLLVLDEATSSLDAESEKRIQEAIESLHGSITILIITHRLATVKNADFIYVMDKGAIVESGSWNSLVGAEHGYFRSMYELQSLTQNTEEVK